MQYFTGQWSLEIWMKVRHMTDDSPDVIVLTAGRAPLPAGAHHPPEDRRLSAHHGRQPQPYRDRQRKLSDLRCGHEKWNYLEIMQRLFVYLEISFV